MSGLYRKSLRLKSYINLCEKLAGIIIQAAIIYHSIKCQSTKPCLHAYFNKCDTLHIFLMALQTEDSS